MAHQFTAKMQKAFSYYANDPKRNKANAYRSAYDCSRMTMGSVYVRANELFKHPIMSQLVAQLNDEVSERAAVDATYIAEKLKLLAEFNISNFLVRQADGTAVYDFSEATEDDWYCIDEYTVETIPRGNGDDRYEVEKVRLKSTAKVKALELLGRMTNINAFALQRDTSNENKHADLVDALANLAEKLPS